MFHTLDGIKTRGDLKYTLHFLVNLDEPDSIEFDSQLEKFNFRIERYGNENFAKINGDFMYSVYENEYPVETFIVGPAYPFFTPLVQIPAYLKYSVLTAEDGTFLWHRGFNEEAFAQSISTNIKEKRFARGGSTITMQLVKNIFLGRNKTVARKLEEALIVWMIENNGIVSKDRILEVYLNIIEWGPGVYGIGEASKFYFSKKPSELSLNESIFLASIIPHPKYFKYSFDKEGNLKKYLSGFYKIVADRMVRKDWITPSDTMGLIPNVILKGEALNFVLPDSLRTDSIPVIEQEDFLN
jgi:membrane carboxypeptidase/penicillin-binding protein